MGKDLLPIGVGLTSDRGTALERQVRRKSDAIQARAELAQVTDQMQGLLTNASIQTIGALGREAEAAAEASPSIAPYLGSLLQSYVVSASIRIGRLG